MIKAGRVKPIFIAGIEPINGHLNEYAASSLGVVFWSSEKAHRKRAKCFQAPHFVAAWRGGVTAHQSHTDTQANSVIKSRVSGCLANRRISKVA